MADDLTAELKTRAEDLASFWDMTMIQVCVNKTLFGSFDRCVRTSNRKMCLHRRHVFLSQIHSSFPRS